MIRKIYNNIRSQEPALFYFGLAHFILWIIFLIMTQIDSTVILGINAWIKPSKFAISIAIFLWTMAAYLSVIPYGKGGKMKNFLRWGFITTMVVEMILIAYQSARGIPSHFNISTVESGIIFGTMGFMIAVSTLLVIVLMVTMILRKIEVSTPVQIGMVGGILIFLVGSSMGGFMVTNMAHSVGGADGGPGLPYVNWSTEFGDYRVAHFFGIHALQIIPLLAYGYQKFARTLKKNVPYAMIFTIFTSILYLFFVLILYLQARAGIPFS